MPLMSTSGDTLSQQPSKRKGFHVTTRSERRAVPSAADFYHASD
jgi:hypothetical protein